MVVDGAVVMVENIVRHMSRRNSEARPALERIREAAYEVQRPVFYAIGIIITAYLPIFTLQSVEGRLFKPMAWTVAFALLGALIFSIVLAPVLASFLFRGDVREWHNPVLIFITERYRAALRLGHPGALDHGWFCGALPGGGGSDLPAAGSSARSFSRIWMKAPFGCAGRWRRAPARPKGRG